MLTQHGVDKKIINWDNKNVGASSPYFSSGGRQNQLSEVSFWGEERAMKKWQRLLVRIWLWMWQPIVQSKRLKPPRPRPWSADDNVDYETNPYRPEWSAAMFRAKLVVKKTSTSSGRLLLTIEMLIVYATLGGLTLIAVRLLIRAVNIYFAYLNSVPVRWQFRWQGAARHPVYFFCLFLFDKNTFFDKIFNQCSPGGNNRIVGGGSSFRVALSCPQQEKVPVDTKSHPFYVSPSPCANYPSTLSVATSIWGQFNVHWRQWTRVLGLS